MSEPVKRSEDCHWIYDAADPSGADVIDLGDGNTHTVQDGEWLSTIAEEYGKDYKTLCEINPQLRGVNSTSSNPIARTSSSFGVKDDYSPLTRYEQQLEIAASDAESGYGPNAENAIGRAREYAKQDGTTVDETRIVEIKALLYPNAYERELKLATSNAESGIVPNTKDAIGRARGYAKQAGIEIDEDRIAEIESLLKLNAYERELAHAAQDAETGASGCAKLAIERAREHAIEAGIDVDENRIAEIESRLN